MSRAPYSKNIHLLAVSVITFIVTGVGFVWFQQLASAQLTQYAEQVQLLVDAEAIDKTTTRLAADLEASATERAELDTYILDVVQIAQFLETVERYADQTGLVIESSRLRTREASEDDELAVSVVEVPYELLGERTAVITFLELMETLPYHSELQSVRIRSIDTDTTRVQADITVAISYQDYD